MVAPHAFNDDRIASSNTVRGDFRWKALHHERLGPTRFAHMQRKHVPIRVIASTIERDVADLSQSRKTRASS